MTTYNITSLSGFNTVDPGNSEGRAEYNTLFTNTSTGNQFLCKDPTLGAQVWQQVQPYVTVGSWTPVLVGSGSAGTGTYVTQVGSYASTGSLVIGWFNLAWSATTGTGNATITGLPIAASASVGVTFTPAWNSFSLPMGTVILQASISSTTISFATIALNSTATPLSLPAAGSLSGSFIYPI